MKSYYVKDWFHEKKMNEMQRNVQGTEVIAISKQSEKAAYVTVAGGTSFMSYWCPKSCMEEHDIPEDAEGTHIVKTYEEAVFFAKQYISLWN